MDEKTIQQAQRGSYAAKAALLREVQDRLYRVCLGLLGDAELAREAVQETAVRILRGLDEFAGESAFETWAIGIAINVAREMRRKERIGPRGWREAGSADPGVEAEAREMAQVVRKIMDDLPQRQREALVLRFFEEMSVEEAGRVMRCAGGTVKAMVHQALRAMRGKLLRRLKI